MNDNRKVILIGTGMVGMSYAYALLNQNACDELVLLDIDRQRAEGEAMDLNHGLAFSGSHMKIYAGDYRDCANADIVVICAGCGAEAGRVPAGPASAQHPGVPVHHRSGDGVRVQRDLPGGHQSGGHHDPGDLRPVRLQSPAGAGHRHRPGIPPVCGICWENIFRWIPGISTPT